jgi:Transposase C of IS166 homeodomain
MLRTVLLQQGEQHAENDKLRLLVQRLLRHQFGRRSEQLSPDQLQLGARRPRANPRREPGGAGGIRDHAPVPL